MHMDVNVALHGTLNCIDISSMSYLSEVASQTDTNTTYACNGWNTFSYDKTEERSRKWQLLDWVRSFTEKKIGICASNDSVFKFKIYSVLNTLFTIFFLRQKKNGMFKNREKKGF